MGKYKICKRCHYKNPITATICQNPYCGASLVDDDEYEKKLDKKIEHELLALEKLVPPQIKDKSEEEATNLIDEWLGNVLGQINKSKNYKNLEDFFEKSNDPLEEVKDAIECAPKELIKYIEVAPVNEIASNEFTTADIKLALNEVLSTNFKIDIPEFDYDKVNQLILNAVSKIAEKYDKNSFTLDAIKQTVQAVIDEAKVKPEIVDNQLKVDEIATKAIEKIEVGEVKEIETNKLNLKDIEDVVSTTIKNNIVDIPTFDYSIIKETIQNGLEDIKKYNENLKVSEDAISSAVFNAVKELNKEIESNYSLDESMIKKITNEAVEKIKSNIAEEVSNNKITLDEIKTIIFDTFNNNFKVETPKFDEKLIRDSIKEAVNEIKEDNKNTYISIESIQDSFRKILDEYKENPQILEDKEEIKNFTKETVANKNEESLTNLENKSNYDFLNTLIELGKHNDFCNRLVAEGIRSENDYRLETEFGFENKRQFAGKAPSSMPRFKGTFPSLFNENYSNRFFANFLDTQRNVLNYFVHPTAENKALIKTLIGGPDEVANFFRNLLRIFADDRVNLIDKQGGQVC